jgi:hypothetical protein
MPRPGRLCQYGLQLALVLLLVFAVQRTTAVDSPAWEQLIRATDSSTIFETSFSSCTAPICPIDASLWRPVDQGLIGAPSYWIETDVDADGKRYESGAVLEQTKNIFSPSSASDPFAGTFLEYIGPVSTSLADYNLYVALNAAVDGMVGVMFRIQDSNNYYRFVWSNGNDPSGSSAGTIQELQVVANGSWRSIATAQRPSPLPLGDFVSLEVRCDGSRIQIRLNGITAIDTQDHTFSSGTWALYNARCPGVRYANVLVTSASESGPTITPPPFPVAGGVQSARASTAPLPAFHGLGSARVVFPLNFTALMMSKFTEGVSENVTQALLMNAGVREPLLSDPPLVLVDLRQGSVIATYAGIVDANATGAWIDAINTFVCSGRLSNLTELGPVSCGPSNTLAIQVESPSTSTTGASQNGIGTATVIAIVVILVVLAVVGTALLSWCILRKRRQVSGNRHHEQIEGFSAADLAEKGSCSPVSTDSDGVSQMRLNGFDSMPIWNSNMHPLPSLPNWLSFKDEENERAKPFCIVRRVQRLLLTLIDGQRQQSDDQDWLLVLDARTKQLIASAVGSALSKRFRATNICLLEALGQRNGDELQRPIIYLLAPAGDWMAKVARMEAKRSTPVPMLFILTRFPNAPLSLGRSLPWSDSKTDKSTNATGRSTVVPIHVDFIALEQRLVTLDAAGDVLGLLYGADTPETCAMRFQLMEELGHQIGTLLHGMGAGSFTTEPPWIQIHTSPAASEQATCIARAAQTYVSTHLLPLFRQPVSADHGSLHLLLMDRAVDPLIPLLHVDTYRGMLLELDFEDGLRIEWPLEHDPVWQYLRGCPLVEATARLWTLARPYLTLAQDPSDPAQNASANDQAGITELIRQLQRVQVANPDQNAELDGLRWHAEQLERCILQQESRRLVYLSELERKMFLGVEADGKTRTSTMVIRRALEEVLEADTYAFPDKVRLLLLFIGSRDPDACAALIQKIPNLDASERDTLLLVTDAFQRRLRAAKWASRAARVRRRRRAKVLTQESLASLLLPEAMVSQILLQYIGAFDMHMRSETGILGEDGNGHVSDPDSSWQQQSPGTPAHSVSCAASTKQKHSAASPYIERVRAVASPAAITNANGMASKANRKPETTEDPLSANLPSLGQKTASSGVTRAYEWNSNRIADEPASLDDTRQVASAVESHVPVSRPAGGQTSTSDDQTTHECGVQLLANTASQQKMPISIQCPEEASMPGPAALPTSPICQETWSLSARLHQAGRRHRKDRFLFVILGGVSAFEIEQIYALAEYLNLELVVGGTILLTPARYLASMAKF